MDIYLRYNKTGFIFGVPARNLTQEEAEIHGVKRLIDSGFYTFADKPKNDEVIVDDFNVDYKTKKARKNKDGE